MPELPEVETIRRGLDPFVRGQRIESVEVYHPRAVRGLQEQFLTGLVGSHILGTHRRGKFMWLDLGTRAVVIHLGMSGQLLIKDSGTTLESVSEKVRRHVRLRMRLSSSQELWFVDQRTFGYFQLVDYNNMVPATITHIAPDLCDLSICLRDIALTIKSRKSALKGLLLDQGVVSGLGNIYTDEMLWAAQLHPRQAAHRVSVPRLVGLLEIGREILYRAIDEGGTSFDELYVNVNGQSGYFAVNLNAYAQHGKPCRRCGSTMLREIVAGRSSHFCPSCQRRY